MIDSNRGSNIKKRSILSQIVKKKPIIKLFNNLIKVKIYKFNKIITQIDWNKNVQNVKVKI